MQIFNSGSVSMWGVLLALVVLATAGVLRADVNVMKDVTLGFGEALDKCRQEVSNTLASDKLV